jgi:hypothetical protein
MKKKVNQSPSVNVKKFKLKNDSAIDGDSSVISQQYMW